MKGKWISYSDEELAWIEAHKAMIRREAHALFCETFGRDDVTLSNYTSLCKRKGWSTGRTGRFEKGQESWNKGKPFRAPGSEKGWFRKGERNGVAEKLYQPIGTERTTRDGYIERKINDDLPLRSRWRAVHLIRWEEAHGPLPEGHCLKCLDGDKANTDPSNWEAIPRAMLPRLNGGRWKRRSYDDAEPEVKPTIMAIAKLEHEARETKKEKCMNQTREVD